MTFLAPPLPERALLAGDRAAPATDPSRSLSHFFLFSIYALSVCRSLTARTPPISCEDAGITRGGALLYRCRRRRLCHLWPDSLPLELRAPAEEKGLMEPLL